MLLITLTANAAPYSVRFDQEQYLIASGQTFPVSVVISPAPEAGLFSFGLKVSFPDNHALVSGVFSIQPNPVLATDGPRAPSPVVGSGPGFAVAKGCADLFATNRPVSNDELLVTFLVQDRGRGSFTLCLTNFNTLGPTEQIFVDGLGQVLDEALAFGCAAVLHTNGTGSGGLEALAVSAITLNRQSGLFEQTVRVTNGTGLLVEGLRLSVTNLPPTWTVWNAHGQTNGFSYFDFVRPIPAGEFVDFRVEYRIPDRNPSSQPGYLAEPFPSFLVATPDGSPFVVEPRGRLPDGSFLIEFDSLPGRSYTVQYSYDLATWSTVVPSITGNGSRLQWIDSGPPKSDQPLDATPQRYYRIFLLP